MRTLRRKGRDIEKALENYAEGKPVVKRELEKQVDKYEKTLVNFLQSVEPEENTAELGRENLFIVNPPRIEDEVKNLERTDQLAAISAAYYAGETDKSLENFLPEGKILEAAKYFLEEDWEDTFVGRGGYLSERNIIFLRRLPDQEIEISTTPPVFRSLAELLTKGKSNKTLEGLLVHESTHAFINQETDYHERFSGEKEDLIGSIDEAAAHVAESFYNSATPPTQTYQLKKNHSKEYFHTASHIIREKTNASNTKDAINQLRKISLWLIQKTIRGEELTEDRDSESYRKAVKAFEDAEKELHPVLKFYGVIDEVEHELEKYKPGHFQKLMQEFNQELETEDFDPHQRMTGLEEYQDKKEDREIPEALEDMKEGLKNMTEYAREQEKREIVNMAKKIQKLIAYMHEENRTLGEELHEFYFTRGKTSPEYLSEDLTTHRRKALKEVLEKYRKKILAEALHISEKIEELLQDIFKHEEKLQKLEKKLNDKREYQETVKLIKFTRDIEKINRESRQRLENSMKEIKSAEKHL